MPPTCCLPTSPSGSKFCWMTPRDLLPALLARMDGRDAADGQRLDVQGASPAQAATMAGLSRTLAGLNTLIQLLHAAEIAREQGGARQQLE